jgi:hypothetical protein
MKVVLGLISALAISLTANEIQVFTGNSMLIPLDKDSKFEKVYVGDIQGYAKAQAAHDAGTIGYVAGMSALAGTSKNLFQDVKSSGGLVGAAVALVGGAAKVSYDLYNEDHEYAASYLATNSKGEKTTILTYIVSNDSIKDNEVETLALAEHKKIVQGN